MEGSSNSHWKESESNRGFNSRPNVFELSRDSGSGRERQRAVMAARINVLRQNPDGFSEVCEEYDVSNDPCTPSTLKGDISLRHWLDKPERLVDPFECLHIYRQIIEIVDLAHSQGVVLLNSRPSCFVIASLNRVSFVESASCSDSGSDSMEDGLMDQSMEVEDLSSPLPKNLASEDFQSPMFPTMDLLDNSSVQSSSFHVARASLIEESGNQKDKDGKCFDLAEEKKVLFPMKQLLVMESSWYTSPEEVSGSPSSCSSDIYRLGVLLFELFCPLASREEKGRTMSSLRHRVLPPQLLLKWPKEASFCLWLLHPEPTCRPKLSELLQSEFLNQRRDDFEEREAAVKLEERIQQQELLLEFLLLIQQRKEEAANKLKDTVSLLYSDIGDVLKQLKILNKNNGSYPELDSESNDISDSGTRKRFRSRVHIEDDEACDENLDGKDKSEIIDESGGKIHSKSSRLRNNFKKIEYVYFLMRSRQINQSRKQLIGNSPISSDGRGSSMVVNGRSSASISASKVSSCSRQGGWINGFLDGLCKYLSSSKLIVKADLRQGDLLNSSNLVSTLTFDRDGDFFATAGVNKKIKVFEYEGIVNKDHDIHYPIVEMVSRSKLSSICWNSYIKCQIASSNFEAIVQVWDVTRSQVLIEMREHEKRVWSIDFSSADPTMLASGGDDGSVKLWSINQAKSIGTIKTKANVCCVQFPSDSSRTLAFGSADHKIYYYDLRNPKMPLCTFVGHNKTVSYVKFIDSGTLVSSSTDNTLRLWDLSSMSASRVVDAPVQSYTGHMNLKNFVGLSVSNGFIATGSETNEIYVYHKAFPMPALSYKFQTNQHSSHDIDDASQFVSSVCWRGNSSTLIAANSTGHIKVLEMV